MSPNTEELQALKIEIVSVTKPIAQHPYECAWKCGTTIAKGKRYVRVVYKNKGGGSFESDHICVDCWTA